MVSLLFFSKLYFLFLFEVLFSYCLIVVFALFRNVLNILFMSRF